MSKSYIISRLFAKICINHQHDRNCDHDRHRHHRHRSNSRKTVDRSILGAGSTVSVTLTLTLTVTVTVTVTVTRHRHRDRDRDRDRDRGTPPHCGKRKHTHHPIFFLCALHSALCTAQAVFWHATLQYVGASVHALHLSSCGNPASLEVL